MLHNMYTTFQQQQQPSLQSWCEIQALRKWPKVNKTWQESKWKRSEKLRNLRRCMIYFQNFCPNNVAHSSMQSGLGNSFSCKIFGMMDLSSASDIARCSGILCLEWRLTLQCSKWLALYSSKTELQSNYIKMLLTYCWLADWNMTNQGNCMLLQNIIREN
jgi:tRNA(Met) C34 N-acetyltransferase TmcA